MSLDTVIKIGKPGKRPKAESSVNWKESYDEAYKRWLAEYLRPEEPQWVAPPSHPLWVFPRRDDTVKEIFCGQLVLMNPSHPLRQGLRFWQRTGSFKITQKGVFSDRVYIPADHEISHYDDRYRLRVRETMGGFQQSGPYDGNGVRAKRGSAPNNDTFEMRWEDFYSGEHNLPAKGHTGVFAWFPRPDFFLDHSALSPVLHLFRFATNRATRIISSAPDHPSPIIAVFGIPANPPEKWRKDHPWTDLYYRPKPVPFDWFLYQHYAPWPFEAPIETCTNEEIEEWRWKYWKRGATNTREGKRTILLPTGVAYSTWPPMPRNQQHSWSRNWRKPWAEDWRTERKMRDLAADLKMYDYGSDRLNVKRMCAIATAKVYPAWLERQRVCGISAKQQPLPFKTRKYLFSPGAGALTGKSVYAKTREPHWFPTPWNLSVPKKIHYRDTLTCSEMARRIDCVSPLCSTAAVPE